MEETSGAIDLESIGHEARECLEWILSGMSISGEVELSVTEGQILLDVICGDDSSVIIGRRGQTLEALQTIVNRISAKRHSGALHDTKIIVDVEGYRDRRQANLLDMAHRAAEEVRESGEPTFLDPLNSYERYLVHSSLKDEPGICTASRGEGLMKQILISPSESTQE